MRFLVFSIIFLLTAGIAFVYQEHRTRQRIDSIKANIHDGRDHYHPSVDAVTITKSVLAQTQGITAENTVKELDEFVNSEDFSFADVEQELTVLEECCPEEDLAIDSNKVESKESFLGKTGKTVN